MSPSWHAALSASQAPSPEAPGAEKAPFLCASYFAREDGRYEPSQTINRCPLAAADVYPPGYVPYGRCRVAVVDFLGEPVQRSQPEPDASCRGCLFEAPLDAAAGRIWEREPIADLDGFRYPTQRRRLQHCGLLLGLDESLPNAVVEQVREHLELDGLYHHLARQQLRQAQSWA